MSKSRRPVTRAKKASPPRRTPKRKPTRKKRGTGAVALKPIYEEIGRKIDELQKFPPSERVKFAIARLTQCRADFEEICGPTMDIPPDPPPPPA